MAKWDEWYESLPLSTKEYLKNQPLWHDLDLAKAFAVGLIAGFLIGWII
jgi:hypothetical protein